MDRFITNYPSTYLIYGNPHCGKTTTIYELINQLDLNDIRAVTSSPEDYTSANICTNEYDIESIEAWINPSPQHDKILILDDFLHLCTENGKIARHLKSIISTTRHDNRRCNVFISSQVMSMGAYIRKMCNTFFLFKVDEHSEKIMKLYLPIPKKTIEAIKKTLIANPYTFLAMNTKGEWQIIRLNS